MSNILTWQQLNISIKKTHFVLCRFFSDPVVGLCGHSGLLLVGWWGQSRRGLLLLHRGSLRRRSGRTLDSPAGFQSQRDAQETFWEPPGPVGCHSSAVCYHQQLPQVVCHWPPAGQHQLHWNGAPSGEITSICTCGVQYWNEHALSDASLAGIFLEKKSRVFTHVLQCKILHLHRTIITFSAHWAISCQSITLQYFYLFCFSLVFCLPVTGSWICGWLSGKSMERKRDLRRRPARDSTKTSRRSPSLSNFSHQPSPGWASVIRSVCVQ